MTQLVNEIRGRLKSPPDVPNSEQEIALVTLETETIAIDTAYQRKISQAGRSKIYKIASAFEWARFGALIVSRDPVTHQYHVIDGQHRLIAALVLELKHVPCVLVSAGTAEQAADFVAINTVRSSVASIDKFRARVVAGDPAAVEVDEMLRELEISTDVAVGTSLAPGETRAATTLEKLVKRHPKGVVFTALETLRDAQPDVTNLLTAFNIQVATEVTAKMIEAERDLERLDAVLADLDFDTLKDDAKDLVRIQGGQTFARGVNLLLQKVNKGLRNPVT